MSVCPPPCVRQMTAALTVFLRDAIAAAMTEFEMPLLSRSKWRVAFLVQWHEQERQSKQWSVSPVFRAKTHITTFSSQILTSF